MSKYIRHQSVISRNADESIEEDHWLKQFQNKLQKDAVKPRAQDSSLFDQITTIMNGKPKYTSVQAAVEDMKNRSGLTAYLDKVKTSESEPEETTKTAAASTAFDAGLNAGIYDSENKSTESIVQKISLKPSLPPKKFIEYAYGYAEGSRWKGEKKRHEIGKVLELLKKDFPDVYENIKKRADNSNDVNNTKTGNSSVPTVIEKKPDVAYTISNIINESKGNLPTIAIIEKVKSIHHNDIPDDAAWDDDSLLMYVSGLNLKERQKHIAVDNNRNLGKNDTNNNLDVDPANTDAFYALTPAKT
jgi:hypothetical protein